MDPCSASQLWPLARGAEKQGSACPVSVTMSLAVWRLEGTQMGEVCRSLRRTELSEVYAGHMQVDEILSAAAVHMQRRRKKL